MNKELKKVLFQLLIDEVTDKQHRAEALKMVNDFCFYAVVAEVITEREAEKLQNYCSELSTQLLVAENSEEFERVLAKFSKRF